MSRSSSAPQATAAWALRVRWDRVGRVALLLVLAIVLASYVPPAISWFSTWRKSGAAAAEVERLSVENKALLERQAQLKDPRTLEREARALGMVRPGERSYVIRDLDK